MDAPEFHDFLVDSTTNPGWLNPAALDYTLNQIGAALIQERDGTYVKEDGYYVMRVFGKPDFVKFACTQQGYCTIMGLRGALSEPEELSKTVESVEYVYEKVAVEFAKQVNEIFENEQTLEACFKDIFKNAEFSRTDNWSSILFKKLDACWREHGPDKLAGLTTHDRFTILEILPDYLDFNIYSQVALNLQNWSLVTYEKHDSKDVLEKIAKKWEKFSQTPLSPGAKMVKDAFRLADLDFNKDLSTVKSLKTINGISPNISFRVTPKGKTPAFADSQNFSTIGIGGDEYVKCAPKHTVWYISWRPGSTPFILEATDNGGFMTAGCTYPFFSKSGGETLNEVLYSRGVAFAFWTGLGVGTLCLPRMNSVMVVTSQDEADVRKIFGSFNNPALELYRDKRTY